MQNKPVILIIHKRFLVAILLLSSLVCGAKALFPGKIIAESPNPLNVFLASPSIAIMPDGTYIASHDWGGDNVVGIYTSVYTSADKGENWQLASTVKDMRWANLFVHNGFLYLMGVKAGFGDIAIRKSTDGGKSWTIATDGTNGLLFKGRYHTGPVPVIVHNGRIWRAYEESADTINERDFSAFVISAPVNSDLLNAANWTKSNGLRFDPEWMNARNPEWCEGNIVITPEGNLVDFMRVSSEQEPNGSFALDCPTDGLVRYKVAAKINISADGKTVAFNPQNDFTNFPGAMTKFTIRYDSVSAKYWTIANKITTTNYNYIDASNSPRNQRNVQVLYSSSDLVNWSEKYIIARWNEGKIMTRRENFGFQYADWQIDGNNIVAVVRTSWYGSDWHDSNMLTFHKIDNFRTISIESSPADLKTLTENVNSILSWQFSSPSSTGREVSANSTTTHSNLNTSVLTRGSGLTNDISFARSFSATAPNTSILDNGKTSAVINNQYFEFTVQSKSGYAVSLSTINAKLSRNSEGPTSYRWAYSLDNTNFTELCSGDIFDLTDTDGNGQVQSTIRLDSYPELQKVPSSTVITFRVYFWRATTTSGRISFGRYDDITPSLSVGGTINPEEAVVTPIIAWNFAGISGTTSGGIAANLVNEQMQPSQLSRGSGLTALSLNNAYYSTFSANSATANGKSNALANNDFYTFKVQAKSGYSVSLTKLNAKLRRNGTGPISYRWMYSLDDVNFKEIGSSDVVFMDNTDSGVNQIAIVLSTIPELQKVNSAKAITFRLYAWGSSSATGGLAFGRYTGTNCLSLEGSVEREEKVLNAWQFYIDGGTISIGKEETYNATTTDNAVTTSTITRGQGNLPSSGHIGGFVGFLALSSNKQEAISNNSYFEFKMQVNPGFLVSLSAIDAKLRRQEFSAYIYRWMYSLNGTDFTEIGSQDIRVNDFAENAGYVQPSIALSGYSELENIPANKLVTFRIYAWGGTETTNLQKHFGFGQSRIATGPSLKITGYTNITTTNLQTANTNNFLKVSSATNGITVVFTNNDNAGNAHFQIKDMLGRLVYSQKHTMSSGENIVYFPFTLNNGIYILSMNKNGLYRSVKFIKQ